MYTIIGGLDAEGKGAVYSFDPVGSYEREQCRAGGAAASLIMPFLDNQVYILRLSTLLFRLDVWSWSLILFSSFVILVLIFSMFLWTYLHSPEYNLYLLIFRSTSKTNTSQAENHTQ